MTRSDESKTVMFIHEQLVKQMRINDEAIRIIMYYSNFDSWARKNNIFEGAFDMIEDDDLGLVTDDDENEFISGGKMAREFLEKLWVKND